MVSGRGVVYVCQVFPWVTQAFTAREVSMLRELGVDVTVVSFESPGDGSADAGADGPGPATVYLPGRLRVGIALLRAGLRAPATVIGDLVAALLAPGLAYTTWQMRLRALLAVARGAWIAQRLPEAAIYHAEFSDEAATAAMTAGALAGRPFSFKSHACFNSKQLGRKSSTAAFVATESEFTRRRYFGAVEAARMLVNRGGVDVADLEAPTASAGPLRILCVATLQEKKGHRHLVEALRLLRDRGVPFRCLLVGSGPLEGEVRGLLADYALEELVELRPYVPHELLAQLYREHDVLALPCVVAQDGDRDGIPAVLLEAAAKGCALVSTPVSGIPELIEDGRSGLLVPERDAAALADALARLAADPDLRAELVRGAQAVLRERFDLRRNVAQLAARFAAGRALEPAPLTAPGAHAALTR